MEMTLVCVAIFAVGTWYAWKDIGNGRGWLCSRFSRETLENLNSEQGKVKKLILAVVIAYITIAFKIGKTIVTLALRLADGDLF